MLQIYKYKGISGFKLLNEHEIRLDISSNVQSQIASKDRFNLFESEEKILRFVAIYMDDSTSFIEFTYI